MNISYPFTTCSWLTFMVNNIARWFHYWFAMCAYICAYVFVVSPPVYILSTGTVAAGLWMDKGVDIGMELAVLGTAVVHTLRLV